MFALMATLGLVSQAQDLESRGPIVSLIQGKPLTAKVSPGHVAANPFNFSPTAISPRPGKANWIWLSEQSAKPAAANFRKEIDLPSAPQSAQVWFSADAHARVYVNGRLVARGPDDGGQDYPGQQTNRWIVNYRDLTPYFYKGRNAIAVEVFTERAMMGRYNSKGRGGLLFEAALQMPDGQSLFLSGDDSWRATPGKEWTFAEWKPGSEALEFDAASEEIGWRNPGS